MERPKGGEEKVDLTMENFKTGVGLLETILNRMPGNPKRFLPEAISEIDNLIATLNRKKKQLQEEYPLGG